MNQEEIRANILAVAEPLMKAGLSKPVIKARCFEYVCSNMYIDVNIHDVFPGFGCIDRKRRPLAPLLGYWNSQIDSTVNKECARICAERNRAGLHMIWKDFDHSVPDWEALVSLGYPGLLKRMQEYRELHKKQGTLTSAVAAHFDGMELTVNALLSHIGKLINFVGNIIPAIPASKERSALWKRSAPVFRRIFMMSL